MIKKILDNKWIFLAAIFSVISCKTKSLENEESAVRATEQSEVNFYKKLPIEFLMERTGRQGAVVAKYETTGDQRVLLRQASSSLPGYLVPNHRITLSRNFFDQECSSTAPIFKTVTLGVGRKEYDFKMKQLCGLSGNHEFESENNIKCKDIFHIATGVENSVLADSSCFFMVKSTGSQTGSSIVIYPQDIGKDSPIPAGQILSAVQNFKPVSSGNKNLGFVDPSRSDVEREMKRLWKSTESSVEKTTTFKSCLLNPRSNNWIDIQTYYYCMLSFEFRSQCYSRRLIEQLYSVSNIQKLAAITDPNQKRAEQLRQGSEAANLSKSCAEEPQYQGEFGSTSSERILGRKVFQSIMVDANILTFNIAEQYKVLNAVFGWRFPRRAIDPYDGVGRMDYDRPNQLRHFKVMQAQK